MVLTEREPTAAIRWGVFWLIATIPVNVVGCDPDLDRRAGRLVVEVRSIPAGADRIEVSVDGRYSATSAVSSASADVVVESVPAGLVPVTVQALMGATSLGQQNTSATVTAGMTERLRVEFPGSNDGGMQGFAQSELEVDVTVSQANVVGQDLEVRAVLSASRLTSFAQSASGISADRWRASEADLEIGDGAQTNVDDLPDLFEGALQVDLQAAGGTPSVRIAEGTLPIDATSVSLPLITHDLSALQSAITSGEVTVVVRGMSHKDSTESFSADVEIKITLQAGGS